MGYWIARWLWWAGFVVVWGCAIAAGVFGVAFALLFISDKAGEGVAAVTIVIIGLATALTVAEAMG